MAELKAEPPNAPRAGPRGNNSVRTFTERRARAGEPVTEHAMPKEATFSSQLSWGYNDMVKLQLLPLETNCVLGLIVCCGSHTGSRMLPS